MPNRLISAAFNAVNCINAAVVYTYTATKTCNLRVQVLISNAAGGGDYVFYLTKQLAGAGSVYILLPKTTAAAAAGETTIGAVTINVDVDNTDVVNVYVDGLAGDNSLNGTVRIYEDDYLRPTVAAQYNTDVTAGGNVGIDLDNTSGALGTADFDANYLTAALLATDAADEIADEVWDELIAGHLGAGSTGASLNALAPGGSTVLNAEITEIHIT